MTFIPLFQMETFTHAEENSSDIYRKPKSDSETDMETDVEAKGSF